MRKLLLPLLGVSLGFSLLGCNTTAREDGALLGGALGAGLGAIVGHQSGHAGEGALIGGAAGAITGAIVGDQYEKVPTQTYRRAHPAPAPAGYYETRVRRGLSGELYEERVWVTR